MRLEVDPGLLTGTAARLRAAVSVARQVADPRRNLTGLLTNCGSARLESAATDFLGEWRYGMGLVAEDAEQLAEMLEAGAKGYQEAEDRIARELE